jgi:hypothetical protein
MDLTSARGIFDAALWLAGFGHFTLLLAGGQLPYRLRWKVCHVLLTSFFVFLLSTYVGLLLWHAWGAA